MNSLLQVFFLFCFAILFFLLVEETNENLTIQKEINHRKEFIINKLNKIKKIELAYFNRKRQFTDSQDSLYFFVKKEQYVFTKKKILYDSIKINGKDSIIKKEIIDTIKIKSLKDSIFRKNETINALLSFKTKKIILKTYQEINSNGHLILYFKAFISKKELFDDIYEKYLERELKYSNPELSTTLFIKTKKRIKI